MEAGQSRPTRGHYAEIDSWHLQLPRISLGIRDFAVKVVGTVQISGARLSSAEVLLWRMETRELNSRTRNAAVIA